MSSAKKKPRKKKKLVTLVKRVPPLVQIAIAPAFQIGMGDIIYGLDATGRVWFYINEDAEVAGWTLVDNEVWES